MTALADGLAVTVFGRPITQGSKTRTRWSMVDDNAERLRPWRAAVTDAAVQAMAGLGSSQALGGLSDAPSLSGWQRLEGPVTVSVAFTFDKPKSAPKTRPCWPTTRSSGDLDKLVRAVFDALTDAGVWRDDSQVVRVQAQKLHVGDPLSLRIPGACITVRAVGS